jgi:periodic tryptophan protein 2
MHAFNTCEILIFFLALPNRFCVVLLFTLSHSQSVCFSPTGTVVFSASLDGTVRAYDLVRYKNFRIMTAPAPCQFSSLAVDPSGEIVCAGALDPFEIYVWSLQTGRLLDVLPGHQVRTATCTWAFHHVVMLSRDF